MGEGLTTNPSPKPPEKIIARLTMHNQAVFDAPLSLQRKRLFSRRRSDHTAEAPLLHDIRTKAKILSLVRFVKSSPPCYRGGLVVNPVGQLECKILPVRLRR